MTGYPGAKSQPGVRQQLISLMPPHQVYVEPFFGTGQIFYAKRPADFSIVADLDEACIATAAGKRSPDTACLVADALQLLPSLKLTRLDLAYLDPPYHPDSRTKKKQYRFELDADRHLSLLAMLQELPCNVILSGYRCASYDAALTDWHRLDYRTMTRGGPRIESAWCNFEPGIRLHDPRFVGKNFRERERIKRKKSRWVSRFLAMPPAERAVIADALETASTIARAASDAAIGPVADPLAISGEGGQRRRRSPEMARAAAA